MIARGSYPACLEADVINVPTLLVLLFLSLLPSSMQEATPPPPPGAFKVPPEIAQKTNPIKPNPEGLAHAKKVYGYDCAMCHGANGDGKGDLTVDMKLTLRDYRDPAALKNLTDGELFYIIQKGKDQMPPEGDRAKDDDIWNLVLLLRSFAKQ